MSLNVSVGDDGQRRLTICRELGHVEPTAYFCAMGDFTRFAITSVIAGTVFVGMTVVSCSGGDDSAANETDATADVQQPDATDANQGDGNICAPTLPVGWPTWTPPNPINATACTHAQVQSYYDDCIATRRLARVQLIYRRPD